MIVIRTIIICDKCALEFIGHETERGIPKKLKAIDTARKDGWSCEEFRASGGFPHGYVVICPDCKRKGRGK